MKLPFSIAFRYFISKKKWNAITIISWIGISSLTIVTAALIIVLSVFNGFESLVINLFHSFDSDLQVTAVQHKFFDCDSNTINKINTIPGVAYASFILEENALLKIDERQSIATLQGVDKNFIQVNEISNNLFNGSFVLQDSLGQGAVLGIALAQALQINPEMTFDPIQIFVPNRMANAQSTDMLNMFSTAQVWANGTFAIQQEFDQKYVFVPLDLMKKLLQLDNSYSKINIKLKSGAHETNVKNAVNTVLHNQTHVLNRYEQNSFMYKIMSIEKWLVFAILLFIILIASFNLIGSISMMIIEKKRDIQVFHALGLTLNQIKNVFIWQGLLMGYTALLIGGLLGTSICLGQKYFSWIKLGSNSFVIDAFPVDIQWLDYIWIFITISLICYAAAYLPANKIKDIDLNKKQ